MKHLCLQFVVASKQYQIEGSWLPASSKKAIKAFSPQNVCFAVLNDYISNCFSSYHATAFQSTVPLLMYGQALLVSQIVILRYYLWDPTPLDARIQSVWPSVLGGPGSLPLQLFHTNGRK